MTLQAQRSTRQLAAEPPTPSSVQADLNAENICSVLQVLGAKWSFLVIAELTKGPKRFNQLHRDLEIVKTQSLTDCLRHLEKSGIVRREVFPTVPVTVEYSLTEKGFDFRTSLKEMESWAARWNKGTGNQSQYD